MKLSGTTLTGLRLRRADVELLIGSKMKALLNNGAFVLTSALALLFCVAMHYELPEAGACLVIFGMFTINLK